MASGYLRTSSPYQRTRCRISNYRLDAKSDSDTEYNPRTFAIVAWRPALAAGTNPPDLSKKITVPHTFPKRRIDEPSVSIDACFTIKSKRATWKIRRTNLSQILLLNRSQLHLQLSWTHPLNGLTTICPQTLHGVLPLRTDKIHRLPHFAPPTTVFQARPRHFPQILRPQNLQVQLHRLPQNGHLPPALEVPA